MNWPIQWPWILKYSLSHSVGKLPQSWFINKRTMSVKHGNYISSCSFFSGVLIFCSSNFSQSWIQHVCTGVSFWARHSFTSSSSSYYSSVLATCFVLEILIHCIVSLIVVHFPLISVTQLPQTFVKNLSINLPLPVFLKGNFPVLSLVVLWYEETNTSFKLC